MAINRPRKPDRLRFLIAVFLATAVAATAAIWGLIRARESAAFRAALQQQDAAAVSALDALKDIQALVATGITYARYQDKLADGTVAVSRLERKQVGPDGAPMPELELIPAGGQYIVSAIAMKTALAAYHTAGEAWHSKIYDDGGSAAEAIMQSEWRAADEQIWLAQQMVAQAREKAKSGRERKLQALAEKRRAERESSPEVLREEARHMSVEIRDTLTSAGVVASDFYTRLQDLTDRLALEAGALNYTYNDQGHVILDRPIKIPRARKGSETAAETLVQANTEAQRAARAELGPSLAVLESLRRSLVRLSEPW